MSEKKGGENKFSLEFLRRSYESNWNLFSNRHENLQKNKQMKWANPTGIKWVKANAIKYE